MKKLILIALLSTPVLWAQDINDAGVPGVNTPPIGQRDALIEGVLGSGDPNFTFITGTQTDRIFRDGVPSVCGVPKSCGTFSAGPIIYDAYTLTNSSAVDQCITISLTVPAGVGMKHAIAYTTEYMPASWCTNYLGDCGSSALGDTQTFSVDLPAGESLVIAVTETVSASLAGPYTLEILGEVDAAGVPTLSQWGLIAFIGLLIVGGLFFIRRKA